MSAHLLHFQAKPWVIFIYSISHPSSTGNNELPIVALSLKLGLQPDSFISRVILLTFSDQFTPAQCVAQNKCSLITWCSGLCLCTFLRCYGHTFTQGRSSKVLRRVRVKSDCQGSKPESFYENPLVTYVPRGRG